MFCSPIIVPSSIIGTNGLGGHIHVLLWCSQPLDIHWFWVSQQVPVKQSGSACTVCTHIWWLWVVVDPNFLHFHLISSQSPQLLLSTQSCSEMCGPIGSSIQQSNSSGVLGSVLRVQSSLSFSISNSSSFPSLTTSSLRASTSPDDWSKFLPSLTPDAVAIESMPDDINGCIGPWCGWHLYLPAPHSPCLHNVKVIYSGNPGPVCGVHKLLTQSNPISEQQQFAVPISPGAQGKAAPPV